MNTESQILNIPIEDIIPNRFQPRIAFDDSSLQELANSIKEHGIIQPLVLRRLGDKYEIIAGERRYKASKLAGLTSVPAIISMLDDKKSAEVAIVENIQRKDLSAIEEAKSFKALLDKGYLTQEELAKKMGLSQSAISNKMRLLSLSDKVQNALMEEKISERHARSLLQIQDKDKQDEWLDRIINERLTVRSLDKEIKEYMKEENNMDNNEIKDEVIETPQEEIKEEAVETNVTEKPIEEVKEEVTESENTPKDDELYEKKPIPNKFFNFLEDEEANMQTEEKEEEIEMLDFAPTPTEDAKNSDFSLSDDVIEDAIEELKNKKYDVSLFKNNENKEMKYTIIVEKNED